MNIANRQIIPVVSIFSYTAFSLGDLQNNSKMMLYVDSPCSTFGDQLVINLTMNHTCMPICIYSFRVNTIMIVFVSQDVRDIQTAATLLWDYDK